MDSFSFLQGNSGYDVIDCDIANGDELLQVLAYLGMSSRSTYDGCMAGLSD